MNIINKEDIDFRKLIKLKCRANNESRLYHNDDELYKIYKGLLRNELRRKNKKIELLSDGANIDNVILPKDKIMSENILSGYSMDYVKGSLILFEFAKRSKNVNDFLRVIYEVSLTLRKIHNDPRNIVVGDLSFSNIIFDKEFNHYFVDFDSVKIDDIPSDTISFLMDDYTKIRGMYRFKVSKETDIFSLMLCTLHTIFGEEIDKISMYDYDLVAERVETLKNIRNIVIEMKKYNRYIPEVPYMDDIIKLPSKQRIKTK